MPRYLIDLGRAGNGNQAIGRRCVRGQRHRYRSIAADQKIHRLTARARRLMVRHQQLGARGVRRDRDRLAASGGVGLVGLAHRLKGRVNGHQTSPFSGLLTGEFL